MCCLTFGSLSTEKVKPVNRHFIFIYQFEGKTVGFTPIGPPYHINEPITKIFKGIARTYLCTDIGSVYSTDNLQQLDLKGGD